MRPLKEEKSDTKAKRPSADIAAPLSPSQSGSNSVVRRQRNNGSAAQRKVNLGSGTTKDRLAKSKARI